MFSLKIAVASAGALTAAVALGLAAPALSSLLLAEIPRAYVTLLAWLKPPYLYFIINGIIISIAAVSRFHKPSIDTPAPVPAISKPELIAPPGRVDAEQDQFPQLVFSLTAAKSEFGESRSILHAQTLAKYGHEEEAVEDVISRSIWPQQQMMEVTEPLVVFSKPEAKLEFDELQPILTTPVIPTRMEAAAVVVENAVQRPIWPSHERESNETLTEHRTVKREKPLVYSRIGNHHHRRSLPEGKMGLGVARQKRSETLEGTWKTITDGRAVPLARHLKKSDTFPDSNSGGREEEMAATRLVRKTETFNERTGRRPGNAPSTGGGRLRKEPSLGQEDLNRKVEAFINKFNEDMRLQRQESMQQYNDMINRGSH